MEITSHNLLGTRHKVFVEKYPLSDTSKKYQKRLITGCNGFGFISVNENPAVERQVF